MFGLEPSISAKKALKPYLRKVPDPTKQIGQENIKPTISALGKKFLN